MGSRQEENSGTREVSTEHQIALGPLEDYLQEHVDGYAGPLTIKQFKGGQSNPTYLLEAASGKYVIRRKPPGKLLKSWKSFTIQASGAISFLWMTISSGTGSG